MSKLLKEIPDQVLIEVGCLRLNQVLKLIPMSRAKWLEGVRTGEYPKPGKFGPRTTVWRIKDLISFIDESFHCDQIKDNNSE